MDKTHLVTALQDLARGGERRTKMGRLRELLPEIEAAQVAGIDIKSIVETLNAQGFDINIKSFPTMLHRARKQIGHVATVSASDHPNRRAGDVQGQKEPNPAAQDGVKGSDEKDGETKATKAPARGARKTKQKELTAREQIAADMAKYEAEQAAISISVKK